MKNLLSHGLVSIASLLMSLAHYINNGSDCFVGVDTDSNQLVCGHIILGKHVVYFKKNLTNGFRQHMIKALS